jgi:CIC family chloride channel protein
MTGKNVPKERTFGQFNFALLTIVLGAGAGMGAVTFRWLIAIIHNAMFLGTFSFHYNANVYTPASPWGGFIMLVPIIGAVGVVYLVKNYAPEAKGHGVPEVIDAIYFSKGVIRPIVAVIKALASALSIGSGGAVGREGPFIQIGSSFGSTLGQILKLSPWQRITLVAAGAGGGIAATFNTPIGGILFATEIMMHEISVRTLVPVSIATVTATYIAQLFFGANPSFVVPSLETPYFHVAGPWGLLAYAGLGAITGLVSAVYIKSIYGFENLFEKHIKSSYYLRHIIGMAIVGVMMYVVFRLFGHYYIDGIGYSTIQDVLEGHLNIVLLLLLLFALKLVAVSLTLGSGASGGIFSPGLYMGATIGGAYGIIINTIFPFLGVSPPAFAVAGMAGVIGGSTGAAMTAIVMIFEMTRDYTVIIPMAITVAVSYGIRRQFSEATIYTERLVQRGHFLPGDLQTVHRHPMVDI